MIDLICLDPYFMGGWVFQHMIVYSGDRDGEIRNAEGVLDPAYAANWNNHLISIMDSGIEIPDSRDKVKLMEELVSLKEVLEHNHKINGLPENVVSPKLKKIRELISDLESEINHEAELKQFAEEAKATSKYGEKSRTIAMLLLILGGAFGAHKFYEGKIGMGILYFFTAGLMFIGLIIDFIVLFEMPEKYIPGQKYHK